MSPDTKSNRLVKITFNSNTGPMTAVGWLTEQRDAGDTTYYIASLRPELTATTELLNGPVPQFPIPKTLVTEIVDLVPENRYKFDHEKHGYKATQEEKLLGFAQEHFLKTLHKMTPEQQMEVFKRIPPQELGAEAQSLEQPHAKQIVPSKATDRTGS